MKQEYEALMRNKTWVLIPRAEDMHVITNKWVFRTKFKADGSLDKYKSRLVARGFQQHEGVGFFDTFSPVAKHSTIRVLFTIASQFLAEKFNRLMRRIRF